MESFYSTVVFVVMVNPGYVGFSTFSRVMTSIVKWQLSLDFDIVTVFLRLIIRSNLLHDLEK